MASVSEIQSLQDINYKSKIKFYVYPLLVLFLFMVAFLNFFPIGAEFKKILQKNLKNTACNPDYDQIRVEWLLPKLVISDLSLPASCLGKEGAPIKLGYVNINFHFISFSPMGVPFKIDLELNGQPLSVYLVQGFGQRMIRIKDQSIVLTRLQPLMGKMKVAGNLMLDLNLLVDNQNNIKELVFKTKAKDFQIPSQNIEDFTVPTMKINDFYLEASTSTPPKISVEKMIIGDPDSPLRANFKGHIDLQKGAAAFSPLNLTGEVAFSENFKNQLPIIEIVFQSFTKKDGFYQIRLGGTLGSPKPAQL